MQQGVLQSTGAGDVVATPRDRLRITPYRTATSRALALDVLIEVEWLGSVRSLLFYNTDDDRDNSTRFLHDHGIADADVLALDFLLIVQCGAGDSGTGKENRLEFGDGRQYAGAADLDRNPFKFGFRLLMHIFVGNRVAGRLAGGAELFPLFEAVDLDDRTIDFVRQPRLKLL